MVSQIIDGAKLAAIRSEKLKDLISNRLPDDREPCLAVVLVGNDPASQIYVRNKVKACSRVGISSREILLAASTSHAAVLETVKDLNEDHLVDGILIQLPLPPQINRWEIIKSIDPKKDVDGLTPYNQGLLQWAKPGLKSCTPLGIMKLIESTGIELSGARAAVIGRSVLVGGPTAILLGNAGATVFSLNSKTKHAPDITREADVIVAAAGVHHLVKQNWVKDGAVVIDVGIHRVGTKLQGDVDFDDVKHAAGFITPVPGGVGPMTIMMLLENTYQASIHP